MTANKSKRRKFSAEFKLNTVLEGYARGNWSATAARHDIHINQIRNWKRQLLQEGAKTFLPNRRKMNKEQKKIEQLEKIIGRITVENEILKKTQELLA